MLESIRAVSQGIVGRAVMTVLLGLIVVSFAVWGIGDVFRGFGSNKVATVGGATISPEEFRSSYQTILQRYQRQTKQPLTNVQAHAIGLDVQTLARLIGDKALDVQAGSLGLAISDETIAKAILNDPGLKDASGAFSRDRFDQALREAGLSERGFVAEQRDSRVRQLIGVSLVNGFAAPKILVEALAKFGSQTRAIDYVVLPDAAAGEIPPPTPEQLQTFYTDRKTSFTAPEYRAVNLVTATPALLAKPGEVSDADARALYDKVKDARFGVPETRKLQQIVFPNESEANDALTKLKAGASFDEIAKSRNLTDKDIDLGEQPRAGVFDKVVAEAAFALPAPGVTDVVKGQFGPAIVRVEQISPSKLKPFEEVASQLRLEIALDRAAQDVLTLHDKIEDARASGKSVEEAAKAVGLQAHSVLALDASGRDGAGAPIEGLEDKPDVVRAIFASDVGVDDQPVQTKDRGFVWFEVTKVEPTRQRSFEEVKDQVAAQWKDDQIAKALASKASEMVQKLNAGASLASLAEPEKLAVKNAADVRRRGGGGLDESVVAALFNTSASGAGSAATPAGRVVFKVTADSAPPFDPADPNSKTLAQRLGVDLADDVVGQYIAALENQLGVSVNDNALQTAESN